MLGGIPLKIAAVAWRGYALPLRSEYATSGARSTAKHGLLVFLRSDNGQVGLGEASPVGAGNKKQVSEVAKALGAVISRLVGTSFDNMNLDAFDIPPELSFGLETALLDIQGKARGLPLVELLGGTARPISVNALVAAANPETAAREARRSVGLGFSSIKLKVGQGTLQQDAALVATVRRAVGPGIKLRLDANGAWTAAQASEAIQRLARFDIEYVEQPVAAGDIAGLAEVRRHSPVPIAADEALGSLNDLRRILAADAADIIIIKASRLGGLRPALGVAHAAMEAGKPVVVTSSLESSIGVAASAHLAAALAPQRFSHGLATGLLFEEDLTVPHLLPHDGVLTLPVGPGLGVAMDARLLEKYGSDIKGSAGSWQWRFLSRTPAPLD